MANIRMGVHEVPLMKASNAVGENLVFISEVIPDVAIFTKRRQQELLRDISNGVIFNDLE